MNTPSISQPEQPGRRQNGKKQGGRRRRLNYPVSKSPSTFLWKDSYRRLCHSIISFPTAITAEYWKRSVQSWESDRCERVDGHQALSRRFGWPVNLRRLKEHQSLRKGLDTFMRAVSVADQFLAMGEQHGLAEFISCPLSTKWVRIASTPIASSLNRVPSAPSAISTERSVMWHAWAIPSMCHPEVKPEFGHHWTLPSPLSGALGTNLNGGPLHSSHRHGLRSLQRGRAPGMQVHTEARTSKTRAETDRRCVNRFLRARDLQVGLPAPR